MKNKSDIKYPNYASKKFSIKLVNLMHLITDLPSFYSYQNEVLFSTNYLNSNNDYGSIFNSIEKKLRKNNTDLKVIELKFGDYYFLVLLPFFKGMIGIGPYKRAINTTNTADFSHLKWIVDPALEYRELTNAQIEKYKEIIQLGDHFYNTTLEPIGEQPPYQQINETSEEYESYSIQKENKFLMLLKNGNVKAIEAYYDFRNKSMPHTTDIRNKKNNLIVLATTLARAAIEVGCNPQEMIALREAIIKDIESPASHKRFVEKEIKILKLFLKKIQQHQSEGLTKSTKMIVNYIQNHLSESITLKQLAEHCDRHPNYISSLFKREKGMTIQQFIISERIKKAKYLIQNSSHLLVDIAHLCGFESQSYFTHQFKNKVGCTPQEYRNEFK
ncbi:helix-turn-helix domain-containing protein [Gracilibacillus dipsosauri]|nr:AraC family transcriptional regulator [Gracilibacillus dipsosauri]